MIKNLMKLEIKLKKVSNKIMEDLNKDIKKPKEKTLEALNETPESVKEKVIEMAEEDMSWVNYNTENIKNNLKGSDGPETEIIDAENQKVADNADKEFKMLKNEVNENIFEKNIPQQLIKLQKEAEIVKSSGAGLQNKYKSINDIFGQMTEITKNCSDEYYKDHRSEFSDTGDFISEIRNNLEYKLIDEFNKGFVLDKENAMAVKASNKSYAEKIEYLQTLINLLHMKETNNENLDILNRQNSLKMSLAETKRFLEAIRDEIKEEQSKAEPSAEILEGGDESKRTEQKKENSSNELYEKIGELDLSNNDLEFFIDKMKTSKLEGSEIFSFAANELNRRKKGGIDHEPIAQFQKRDKETNRLSEGDIAELKEYDNDRLILSIQNSIEMLEGGIIKENLITADTIEYFLIEEEIKEAKNINRKIDTTLLDKLEKSFKDIKEKVFLAAVMGNLNKAEAFANDYQKNNDIESGKAAGYWIISARREENKYIKNINKFDLEAIDNRVKMICKMIGCNENGLDRASIQSDIEDHERFVAIDHEIAKKMKLRENNVQPESSDEEPSAIETPEPEGITIDDIWNKLSNNEKVTDEEIIFIMLKIRSIDVEENGELTEDESKIFQIAQEMEKRGYALTDKSAEKLINDFEKKTKAEIGEAIEADEDSKKYNEKDQKGKEAEISDKKNKLEGEIKGEGIEIGRNIGEMEEQMKNIKKDLEEKFKSYLGMEKELSRICATEGILEQKDKEELINVFKLLKNIYKGTLNTDKISFLAETLKENKFDPNNPDALINTYNQRNYNIKRLEETISSLDVEIEKLEKGEEEAFSRMIDWIKSHPKEIALVAGVAGGVILAPFIAKALAGAGVGLALETGIPLAAKGALVGAKAISLSLLKVGGIAAILAGLLLNGEKIDDFMESITGKKIPSWASWGLKKKGERK